MGKENPNSKDNIPMTTPQAAVKYLAEYLQQLSEENEVYNPSNIPLEELPVIMGFCNGGGAGFYDAIALAEDGTYLGGHICSHEGYMRGDLGIAKGTRRDRHEADYKKHYPNGYIMEFVSSDEISTHTKLHQAFKLNQAEAP